MMCSVIVPPTPCLPRFLLPRGSHHRLLNARRPSRRAGRPVRWRSGRTQSPAAFGAREGRRRRRWKRRLRRRRRRRHCWRQACRRATDRHLLRRRRCHPLRPLPPRFRRCSPRRRRRTCCQVCSGEKGERIEGEKVSEPRCVVGGRAEFKGVQTHEQRSLRVLRVAEEGWPSGHALRVGRS
jgi:hypothetical protein